MKKLNKFFAVLVALAMMATLCVSMAFADDETPAVDPSINKTHEAYFTKTWAANDQVSTEAKDFTFTISQVKEGENVVTNTQDLSVDKIHFDKDQTGTKTSENLFKNATWTNSDGKVVPGKYVYTVKEDLPAGNTNGVVTDTEEKDTATITKKTTYSTKEYTMEVFVNKSGTVEAVVVKEGKKKVTSDKPTAGSDNGFNFKNTYSESINNKPTGSDPEKGDPKGEKDGKSLAIEKEISAREGYIDNDQAFTFSTTVTFPEIDPADQYKAYVIEADGKKGTEVLFEKPDKANEDGKYVATQSYTLKHGERLFFENIDLGATYTATESNLPDGYTMNEGTDQASAKTIVAAGNYTKIVNTYNKAPEVPEEGILISNLPYIALALVAIGGLVAYVVVRRKNEDNA